MDCQKKQQQQQQQHHHQEQQHHRQTNNNVIEYKTLLQSCQRKMFISSDMHLRNIVQELSDHNIVQIQRDENGMEVIYINESLDILETIIAFQY